MKTIVSFGDSFVFGSELANNSTGALAWPGLVAQSLGAQYHTCAVPGCGNDHIARQILSWFSNHSSHDTLAVINWTWMSRWDFYIVEHETWITLGPTCVPDKLRHLVNQTQSQDMIDFYQSRINSSILWNRFRNLQTLYATQNFLRSHGVRSIQTYMDTEMFDQQWHAPDYVQTLQSLVLPELQTWQGKNFLDWSRDQGFLITDPGWHPLEQAHQAAADFWHDRYRDALTDSDPA